MSELLPTQDGELCGPETRPTQCESVPTQDGELCGSETEPPQMSKNQLKKLKRKEHYEQWKPQKRLQQREKRKARRAAAIANGDVLGPSRKSLKRNLMKDSNCKVRVVVDCSFDAYMNEREITKLVNQLQHCYSINRRAPNPLQLYMCSISDKAKYRLEEIGDYQGWDVHASETDYKSLFQKDEIIYLSSESPNILSDLDVNKVYIIGGLVDHNHEKGLCHRLAEEQGIVHAQLPVSDYIHLNSRNVLCIDHVFGILLRFTETDDWRESFVKTLPARKTDASQVDSDLDDKGAHCNSLCVTDCVETRTCEGSIPHTVISNQTSQSETIDLKNRNCDQPMDNQCLCADKLLMNNSNIHSLASSEAQCGDVASSS